MNAVNGVIFDWDGTLADSQTAYVDAWRTALTDHGYQVTSDDETFLIGRAFPHCLTYFLDRADLGDGLRFEAVWRREFHRRVRRGITLFDDAVECLKYVIEHKIHTAVATQTPRAQFDKVLATTELYNWVQVSVCRDEVANPKPAPDIYREACHKLQLRPRSCIAVEDSSIGARSARDAGLKVLGIARDPVRADELGRVSDKTVQKLTPQSIKSMLGELTTIGARRTE